MNEKLKFNLFAGASVASLIVGAVWLNDEESIIAGILLVFGFLGTVVSAVSLRNKMKS